MNARTAAIAVIATLALGVVTYFALQPRSPAPMPPGAASRLSTVNTATLVRVADGDESVTLTAAPELDTWLIQAGPAEPSWPAETGAVQGALRLLSELSRVPAHPSRPPASTECASVTLALPNQPDLSLLFTRQSLGGTTKAHELTADTTASLELDAPSQTAELFRPRNVLAWRRPDLLAAPGTPTDIRIESSSATLAFKQVDGKWTLMLPVPAPVEPAAMKELLSATLPATRFTPSTESTPPSALNSPVATITRTTRIVNTRGDAELITTEVTIGTAADTAQETFHASAVARRTLVAVKQPSGTPSTAWGPVNAVLDGASITAIARTPEYYVSKRAVQVPAADIAGLRVLPPTHAFQLTTPLGDDGDSAATYVRTLDGWTRDGTPLDGASASATAALLFLLSESPAARVHLTGIDHPITPHCALAVRNAAGGLVEVVGIGEDETSIYIRSGRVIREYTKSGSADALTLLRP